jgi:hypothetical protein
MINHPNRSRHAPSQAGASNLTSGSTSNLTSGKGGCEVGSHDWDTLSDDGTVRRMKCRQCGTKESHQYRSTSGL